VLVKGYLGPTVLGADAPSGISYLVDPRVGTGTRWLTGANEPGRHVFDLVCGRDFTPDGTIEAADVREGDPAPDGSGPLSLARGIEMGHVFQLGRKYADALGLQVLDQHGKLVTVTMGSYGVGVSRAVAAVAEGTCDEKGLCWPRELAPFDVQLLATGKDDAVSTAAADLAVQLDEAGVSVLLDDRKASPGVKFADAEIMGMPTIVVVGRGLAEGVVEVRDRRTDQRRDVPVADALGEIVAIVHSARTGP
jgi:prolyl-tRNA synthetase